MRLQGVLGFSSAFSLLGLLLGCESNGPFTCSGGLELQLSEYNTLQEHQTMRKAEGQGVLFLCADRSCSSCSDDGPCRSAIAKEPLLKRSTDRMKDSISFFRAKGVTIPAGSFIRVRIWDPAVLSGGQKVVDETLPVEGFPVLARINTAKAKGEVRCIK
jgi:hypothetical protein